MDIGIDFSLILYILFAFAVGMGIPFYLMKQDRLYAAVGVIIVSIAVFIFFGMRWFDGMRLKQSILGGVPPDTQWPPQINVCPDFLSLKQVGTGRDAKFYCVDAMGVSGLKRFTSTSAIEPDRDTTNYMLLTKGATAQDYTTNFFIGGNTQGTTWEGVYDGMTATNVVPPYPA